MNQVQKVCGDMIASTPEWVVTIRNSVVWSRLQSPIVSQMSALVAGQTTVDNVIKALRNEYDKIVAEVGKK